MSESVPTSDPQDRRADRRRYLALVLGVMVVGLAGYVGYVVYPRFALPPVEGAGVFVLAAAAGIASFFSPCSFPLLLAILGRQQAVTTPTRRAASRDVAFGTVLALGAGTFLLLAGLVIAVGGGLLVGQVTFTSPAGVVVRMVIGLLLIVLGLIQVGVIASPFHLVEGRVAPLMRRQARLRRDHPLAGHALFGFMYIAAGFG